MAAMRFHPPSPIGREPAQFQNPHPKEKGRPRGLPLNSCPLAPLVTVAAIDQEW